MTDSAMFSIFYKLEGRLIIGITGGAWKKCRFQGLISDMHSQKPERERGDLYFNEASEIFLFSQPHLGTMV